MGAWLMIARRHEPSITSYARFAGSHVNHGLNCQYHANLKLYAAMRASVITHVGILMHMAAYAVTHIFANNTVSLSLGNALNGMSYIA